MTIKKNRTFSDLVFTDHANNPNGVQARLDLGNNLEISVVSMKDKEAEFGGLYGSVKAGTYEVAVFHNTICFRFPLGMMLSVGKPRQR